MMGARAIDSFRNDRTGENPVALEVVLEIRKGLQEAILDSSGGY